ncbi:MAG: DUF4923 family protein [Lachnospiraceae bacterium]|nr:DUF4923 family protein [Lachnospiraceae bacterium]
MTNWKKLATVLGLTAAVAFTMVGCGGGKTEEKPAASTAAASEAASEEATEEETEVAEEETEASEEETEVAEEVQGAEIIDSWTLDTIIDADGNEQTLAEYAKAQGVDMGNVQSILTINDDGTCTMSLAGIPVEGTYTYDGETLETDFTGAGGSTGSFTYDASLDVLVTEDAATGMSSHYTRGAVEGDTIDSMIDDAMEEDGSESAEAADASAIVGDWAMTTITDADGNSYTLEEYAKTQGVDASGLDATYTFNEDGTVVGAIAGIGVEGTYEFDGSQITVDFSEAGGTGGEFTYDATNDVIYAEDANSGLTSYMERQ